MDAFHVARTMRTWFPVQSATFLHEVNESLRSEKQHWFLRMLNEKQVPNVCGGFYIHLWKMYIGQLGRLFFRTGAFNIRAINEFWEDFFDYVEEDVMENGVVLPKYLKRVRICLYKAPNGGVLHI